MAVTLNNRECSLVLQIVKGKKADGSDQTATVTITNINPEITNDDLLPIAQALGNLQEYTIDAFIRSDKGDLANEAE